jgi:chemotaxis protein MotB
MFFARYRNSTRLEIWPTFVDALSTVLMAIVFVMMTVLVSQVFLVETINDRDTELAQLEAKLRLLESNLQKSETDHKSATLKVQELEKLIQDLNLQLAKLTSDVTLEKNKNTDHLKAQDSLKVDLAALEAQLKQLKDLLKLAQDDVSKKDDELKKLQLIIGDFEKEQSKHNNAIRVGKFRSEFFAQLQKILGTRNDIRVVDDRFVFQSEVLFDVGSAELGNEGKKQLDQLINVLKEIGSKIPEHIHWVLRIDGHTDKRPIKSAQFPSNWELSSARAIAVVQYMIKQGIEGKHLVAAGFGEYQPLNDAKDRELDKDRRIEFKLDKR